MRTKTQAINVKMLHAQLQLTKNDFYFWFKLMSKQPNILMKAYHHLFGEAFSIE